MYVDYTAFQPEPLRSVVSRRKPPAAIAYPKKIPRDLVHLMEKQIETLDKETFGSATDVELREYEERENRIDELCEKLRYATLLTPCRIGNALA